MHILRAHLVLSFILYIFIIILTWYQNYELE